MTTATLEDIKTRLALIQPFITGTKVAYQSAPNTINPTDMPCWVNLTGEGVYDPQVEGFDGVYETRNVRMLFFAAPRASGTPGEAENLCGPFFSRVRDFFLARPGLSYIGPGGVPTYDNLPGVMNALVTGDSGTSILTFADVPYFGIEFRLTVFLTVLRTYAQFA